MIINVWKPDNTISLTQKLWKLLDALVNVRFVRISLSGFLKNKLELRFYVLGYIDIQIPQRIIIISHVKISYSKLFPNFPKNLNFFYYYDCIKNTNEIVTTS